MIKKIQKHRDGIYLGEVARGKDIGSKSESTSAFIWHACIKCGKRRWVRLIRRKISGGEPVNLQYRHCNAGRPGQENGSWKGGRRILRNGYVLDWLPSDDFFRSMATKEGYVREHRLVMAKHLNRCLLSWEVVHHRNGLKSDNRLENLELIGCRGKHNTIVESQLKKQAQQIKEMQARIILLEAENTVLKMEMVKVNGF